MTYRIQDIVRIVIPGLYFIVLTALFLMSIDIIEISDSSDIAKLMKSPFANTTAVILPFVGFVVGYIINIISSFIERKMYKSKMILRPSAVVLNHDDDYYIEELSNIKTLLSVSGVNNKSAHKAFQKAKESILGNEGVAIFYAQSVLARNLAFGQLFFTLLCLGFVVCVTILALIWTVSSLVMTIILIYNWRRQSCIYAKYVFTEYGRDLGKNK